MGVCDICGRKTKTRKVKLEGAIIEACYVCVPSSSMDVKHMPTKEVVKKVQKTRELDIVENYNKLIKEARERMGISLEELAKKLNLSLNYLRHIEKGEMIPDGKTARKLEKFLKIKLFEEVLVEEGEDSEDQGAKELTMADQAEWESA